MSDSVEPTHEERAMRTSEKSIQECIMTKTRPPNNGGKMLWSLQRPFGQAATVPVPNAAVNPNSV